MSITERIEHARAACATAMSKAPLAEAAAKLKCNTCTGVSAVDWIAHLSKHGHFPPGVHRILAEIGRGSEVFAAERLILLQAALQSLDRLHAERLDLSTQALICKQYEFFAAPQQEWVHRFDSSGYPYRAYARIGLLQRFPAGRLDWEVSGIPRSWIPKLRMKELPKVLATIAFELRGRSPVVYTHVSYNQSRFQTFAEKEVRLSYLRVVRSLALRPELRAIVTDSWLYSKETQRVSPHLAWTTRLFEENGGIVVDIGMASPDSGFLVGNAERQKLFSTGDYRPTRTAVIWPRRAALEWLAEQPDSRRFDDWPR